MFDQKLSNFIGLLWHFYIDKMKHIQIEMILSDKIHWNNPIPKFNNFLSRLKTKAILFFI